MRGLLVALVVVAGCSGGGGAAVSETAETAAEVPTCAMEMSSPLELAGSNFFGAGSFEACWKTRWNDVVQLVFASAPGDAGVTVLVDISADAAAPGNTIDLASGGAWVSLERGRGDYVSCSAGAATWGSDDPDWTIAVDATCDDGSTVRASWRGHTYVGND